MTLLSLLKFLITPHTGFISLWSPFLEPKKKKKPTDLPTQSHQSIYEHYLI